MEEDLIISIDVYKPESKDILNYSYSMATPFWYKDWRNTFPCFVMTEMIDSIITQISRYKDKVDWSNKTKNKKFAHLNIDHILKDFINKELKNVLRVTKKSMDQCLNPEKGRDSSTVRLLDKEDIETYYPDGLPDLDIKGCEGE